MNEASRRCVNTPGPADRKGIDMTEPTKTTTKPVTQIRRTTPGPFAGLACAFGHTYRVVLERNQPIALECVNCATTWKTERVEREQA
jgi:hypothetical protein